MESTEKTLILKVGRLREVDAWLRLFSPRKGVFTAFAFGGSVSRRRFLGCLDPLNVVSFKIKTDTVKGYTYLLEGALLASHPRLRKDSERLGMAVNCLKFLEAAHLGPAGSESAFELLLGTLAALDREDAASPLLPLFYRARTAFDQGFKPDLSSCARCGAPLDGQDVLGALFLVEQGKFLCGGCRTAGQGAQGRAVALGSQSLFALEKVATLPPGEWSALVPSSKARMECGRCLDAFVEHHLGLTWNNGSFRRV